MARDSGPYAKRRVKVNKDKIAKQKEASQLTGPIYKKKYRTAVLIVIAIIVLSMTATLVVPYFGNTLKGNYSLPDEVLKANEEETNNQYIPGNITLGNVYSQEPKEYYVILGNQESLSKIEPNLIRVDYFSVDTNDFMNKQAVVDVNSAQSLPQNPKDIKVKDNLAILKIVDGKAVDFINNEKDAISYSEKLK